MEHGTSEGRYLFELDGVSAIRASECSAVKLTQEEFELYESNRPNPNLGRGHFKIDTINVKHAHALNQTGIEFFVWLKDFVTGINVERRSGRLIVLDEDGQSPVQTYELKKCVPISFSSETHTAGGKSASMFTFSLRPEDYDLQ